MKHIFPLLLLLLTTARAADPAALATARALYGAKKYPEAEAALKKLAAAEPANAEIQFSLGELARQRGDLDLATKNLERATQLAPQNADYQCTLGDVYAEAAQKAGILSKFGLAKKCLAAFQRAAELDPASLRAHQSLFEYYRQAPGLAGGGTDKAEAEAAILVKLNPIRGHTAFVTLYVADKKYELARPHAAELKKLDPNLGRQVTASLLVAEQKFDAAFAEFDTALQAVPDDYATLYQLGKLSATSGKSLDRGLLALRRCLELTPGKNDPTHAAAHWRLGNILEKKADKPGARAAYEASLKAQPGFKRAAEALEAMT